MMPSRTITRNVSVVDTTTPALHWAIKHSRRQPGWHSVQPITLWLITDDGAAAFVPSAPWTAKEGGFIAISALNRQQESQPAASEYRIVRQHGAVITCPECGMSGVAESWYAWWLKTFWPDHSTFDDKRGTFDWTEALKAQPANVR